MPGRPRGLRRLLLAGTVLVSACSIAATTWLSVQSTTETLRAEQGRAQEGLARVHDAVLGYGATHPAWTGVAPLLAELSRETGLRIRLTTPERVLIGGAFGPDDPPLAEQPSAVVDPLNVDLPAGRGGAGDRIDPRAVGPFRLTAEEREISRARAQEDVDCARGRGVAAEVRTNEAGRSFAWPTTDGCASSTRTTDTEEKALRLLNAYSRQCHADTGTTYHPVLLDVDGSLMALVDEGGQRSHEECLASARRTLLTSYVAPAALLFVGEPVRSHTVVGLPAAGVARIALAASLVLVLAVGVSSLLAGRVLRPLTALTEAARRMRAGDLSARARVAARWEVAEVAAAFNDMSEHLARAEALRKNLVNDLSHELRTPLGTMRGWLVAAQEGVAELDQDLLDLLLQETLVLQHLVDDLQELAAADAGELRLRPEPVDAAELLAGVAAAHRVEADLPDGGGLPLVADPVRLRQVVRNLVVNAVQHTPADGRVVVRGRLRDGEVVLEVVDSGRGIAAEDLPHVFDRFWRADRSRARATGGRGLGLAIAKHHVVAHGGTITVTSEVGKGTTFTVRLPAGRLPAKESDQGI
ncbi:two-component system sensor histidine kinase BaeS [Saccharothrix coeruleofusca]|uniref:sensor histidine kinase n=1 Tax=Saccharothrix coeruleofusca TaxID=33919 RepID=UPI001AE9BAD2|nr:HAMP domain-containing sensor histidine kinase [Saccharothrix coeruleofusca]MBP2338858.1 two-component system sensor histidine kinase BaeS [Saccharothrix coeruleofusca]